jgi:hypothetical protein
LLALVNAAVQSPAGLMGTVMLIGVAPQSTVTLMSPVAQPTAVPVT